MPQVVALSANGPPCAFANACHVSAPVCCCGAEGCWERHESAVVSSQPRTLLALFASAGCLPRAASPCVPVGEDASRLGTRHPLAAHGRLLWYRSGAMPLRAGIVRRHLVVDHALRHEPSERDRPRLRSARHSQTGASRRTMRPAWRCVAPVRAETADTVAPWPASDNGPQGGLLGI